MLKKLQQTKFSALFDHPGFQAVFGLFALVAAYVFASWAIDSGSLLDYAISLLLLFVGIQNLTLAIFKRRKS